MNEWTRVKIGDMSESCLGKMLDKEKNKGELQPYLSNKSVRWGSFDLNNLSSMRFENHEKDRYGLVLGDLIVCEGGEPGRCAIWQDQIPNMKIQKALHRVRVKPNFSNQFLYYRFLLAGKSGQLDKYFIGSTIKHLTGVNLKKIEFDFPSFQTQKRIAKILSDLDSKIELNNKINAELEAMAKLIYDYWFVQFDFPNTKGKPYKTSGGKMVWSEELKREIPEGWEAGALSNLGEIIGGSTPPREVAEYFTSNGTPWITPKDLSLNTGNKFITRGKSDVSAKGIKSASLNVMPKGTVLLSSRAPIGYLAIARGEVTTNQGFKSFVPNKGFSTEYIYYSVKNMIPTIEKNAVGSTFKEVSGSTLKSIPVHLPSKAVVTKYTAMIGNIFSKQNLLELENQKLSELRDWLLPMLMSGQVQIKEAGAKKIVKFSVKEVYFKPAKPYFYQIQVISAIVNASKQNKISHGEMTLAKYSYLLDKVYKIPTLFNYDRWHLGPYPKEMKKVVNNKKFFKIQNNEITVVPQKKEYNFQFQRQVEDAVIELASIFSQYKGKGRSHQTELLATVCKVVEDIQSTDLKAVRDSMKRWPIKLESSKFKNKAEKFSEEETNSVLKFILSCGWSKALIPLNKHSANSC